MDFSQDSAGSNRQHCPSSGASSTRHILISPAGSTGGSNPQASTSGSQPDNRLLNYQTRQSHRRPSKKSNLLLTESFSTGAVPAIFNDQYLVVDNKSDDSSTCTDFSTRSAPQTGLRSEFSLSSNRGSHRERRHNNSDRRRIDFEPPAGYLKISTPMLELMIKHRRPLLAITFTILYASYGLSSIIFRSNSQSNAASHSGKPAVPLVDWTQEMIAGWHQDRPIILPSDDLHDKQVRVRECRSRAQQHHKQLQLQQQQLLQNVTTILQDGNKQAPEGVRSSNQQQVSKAAQVIIRRRHKFEALNGCFFRRESTSESTGDLCCCAGIPRFVIETPANYSSNSAANNVTTATNTTKLHSQTSSRKPVLISNSSISDVDLSKLDLKQRSSHKKYLKPQVMCFVSAAANLFNSQKLVAPIANEYNLMHTFIKGKGKCITCSCCHEHEPEKVNKLLANVPLYANKLKSKSMMLDKNGNQLVVPSNGDDEDNTGLWIRTRAHLIEWMRYLDDIFFWLYDLLDLTSYMARYGDHPANFSDSTGLLLIQSYLIPLESFVPPKNHVPTSNKPVRSTEPPSLFIDDDLYHDFTTTTTTTSTSTTTTTTTTTTSTTTAKPRRTKTSSNGLKKRKKKRRQRTSTTTTTSKRPSGDSTSGQSTTKRPEADKLSTTTTKSPTVIINVYAGNQAASSVKEAVVTTTSTKKPVVVLIASDTGKLAAAKVSADIGLLIGLNGSSKDGNETIRTSVNNHLGVPAIESNSSSTLVASNQTILQPVEPLDKQAFSNSTKLEPQVNSADPPGYINMMDPTVDLQPHLTGDNLFDQSATAKHEHLGQLLQKSPPTDILATGQLSTTNQAAPRNASHLKPSITISVNQNNSSAIIATINTTQIEPSTVIQPAAIDPSTASATLMATHSQPAIKTDVSLLTLPISINFSHSGHDLTPTNGLKLSSDIVQQIAGAATGDSLATPVSLPQINMSSVTQEPLAIQL